MSWTDKELAEMAKTSQAEQKFAYNDAYFAEVEAMLPKKKKRIFPFFTLPLIPMMGVLAYIGLAEPISTNGTAVAKTMDMRTTLVAHSIEKSKDIVHEELVSEDVRNEHLIKTNNTLNPTITTTTPASILTQNVKSGLPSRKPSISNQPFKSNGEFVGTISDIDVNKEPVFDIVLEPIIPATSNKKEVRKIEFTEKSDFVAIKPSAELLKKEKINMIQQPVDRLNPLQLSYPLFTQVSPSNTFGRLAPFTPRSKWAMYIEAGAGMGESYITSQVGHTQAVNFGLGARYDFKNTFFQFGAAGEFQKVNMELSERAKIYHTSSTELENRMNYKQLYRIQMPLTFGYKLNKHSIQASLIPSYLIGAKMNYTYLEDGQAMRNETMYNQRKGWNDFSTSVGFGYGYQVFKGLTLGANVNWQFMNQVNRKEVSEGNTKPMSGQVFIRKTLK